MIRGHLNRWRVWFRWALILGGLALLAGALPALAHPKIVETVPAENAQLATSPPAVRMVFDEPLEAALSQIAVFDARRQQVGLAGGRAPEEPMVLAVRLPPLAPGVYTVVWQTVGSDGHLVKGNFAFSLLEPEPAAAVAMPESAAATSASTLPEPPTAAPLATADSSAPAPHAASETASTSAALQDEQPVVLPILAAVLRALMLLGALGMLGAWVSAGLVLPSDLVTQSVGLRRRIRVLQIAGLFALLLGVVGIAALHTLVTTGTLNGANLATVIGATRFGQALLLRLLLGLGLLVLLLVPAGAAPWRQALVGLLGGALLLTFALAGHAAAQEQPLLPVLADWLHLAATALWVGGLLLLALALPAGLSDLDQQGRVALLATVIQRFSPLALLSVVVLAATGAYSALLHLDALSDLWTSAYGRALLTKLLLFAVLLTIGAYQLMRVRPRLLAWSGQLAEALAANAERRAPSAERIGTALRQQEVVVVPAVHEEPVLPVARWQRRFFGLARAEVGLALLALLAVGFLTSLAPPEQAAPAGAVPGVPPTVALAATPTPRANALAVAPTQPLPTHTPVPSRPFSQTQTAADLQLRLEVSPASIDQNQFAVEVRDQNGQPLEVQLVRLTAEMLEMDMGTRQLELAAQGGGRYRGEAPRLLSMVGDWQLRLLVRRVDAADVEVVFTVPVGE